MAASQSSRRAVDEPDTSVASLYKPKLVVAYGRGGSGKSTGIRYIVERAQAAGRDLVIADADPRNPGQLLRRRLEPDA